MYLHLILLRVFLKKGLDEAVERERVRKAGSQVLWPRVLVLLASKLRGQRTLWSWFDPSLKRDAAERNARAEGEEGRVGERRKYRGVGGEKNGIETA
jgi:hypothetical protein